MTQSQAVRLFLAGTLTVFGATVAPGAEPAEPEQKAEDDTKPPRTPAQIKEEEKTTAEKKAKETFDEADEKHLLPQSISHFIKGLSGLLSHTELLSLLPKEWREKLERGEKVEATPEELTKFFTAAVALLGREIKDKDKAVLDPNLKKFAEIPKEGRDSMWVAPADKGGGPSGWNDRPGSGSADHGPGGGTSPGGRSGSAPRGSGGEIPTSQTPFPKDELMPSGVRGNPSMELVSKLGGGAFGHCQFQLSYAKLDEGKPVCGGSSAAHCVFDDKGRRVSQFNTAYGEFTADVLHVPTDDGTVNSDIAFVHFSGETCKKMIDQKIETLEVCQTAPSYGDRMLLGTRYFGKAHFGSVFYSDGLHASVNLNYLDEGGNHQGGVHTGDSGGSATRIDPSTGKKCLGGVLSASEHAATVHSTNDGRPTIGGTRAYYATNVAFLRREAAKIGGRSARGFLSSR